MYRELLVICRELFPALTDGEIVISRDFLHLKE
jgi:hypothetical protein